MWNVNVDYVKIMIIKIFFIIFVKLKPKEKVMRFQLMGSKEKWRKIRSTMWKKMTLENIVRIWDQGII